MVHQPLNNPGIILTLTEEVYSKYVGGMAEATCWTDTESLLTPVRRCWTRWAEASAASSGSTALPHQPPLLHHRSRHPLRRNRRQPAVLPAGSQCRRLHQPPLLPTLAAALSADTSMQGSQRPAGDDLFPMFAFCCCLWCPQQGDVLLRICGKGRGGNVLSLSVNGGYAGGRRRYQPMADALDPSAVRAADMAFGEEAHLSASYVVPKSRAPAVKVAPPVPVATHARFSELYISRSGACCCLLRTISNTDRAWSKQHGMTCCFGDEHAPIG